MSQIVFILDAKIKAKAMKRAKSVGIPFASYLKQATEDFAEGKTSMAIVRSEIPNAKTALEIRTASADFRKGKNLSPMFTTAEDMDRYLNKLRSGTRGTKI